jgi:hypothetical protein
MRSDAERAVLLGRTRAAMEVCRFDKTSSGEENKTKPDEEDSAPMRERISLRLVHAFLKD